MKRTIRIGLKAREELAAGADFLANAVKRTLGVYGDNFFLDSKNTITNDGVTVAREIQINDCVKDHPPVQCEKEGCSVDIQNRGAAALREAAVKTVEEVGDGTTTAVALAQGIYHECARFLPLDGVLGKKSPSEIRVQIEQERKEVTDKLISLSKPISSEEELVNSAIVSMGDKELGSLIGKAQWKLGKDGVILAEETAEDVSTVEYVRGITIDNGFGTSSVVNNQEKQTLEVTETKIILTSHTIRDVNDWQKLFKGVFTQLNSAGFKNVVVIARAWTDDTIRFCLENINKGTLKIYPLSAPYVNMAQRMKDLSALTGAIYFDSESSQLEDINITGVGYAEKVVARRMDAVITGKDSVEATKRVDERLKELADEVKGSQSDFERKQLAERIAQLNNGFALLKIASQSAMERRRLFDKADDAVHAVRAAFQEGTVQGGGLAFKEIADGMPSDSLLKRPLLTINQLIMASAPKGFVIEDWVRDPVKVLRIALENACAAASSFALAGGVVTEKRVDPLEAIFKKRLQPTEE